MDIALPSLRHQGKNHAFSTRTITLFVPCFNGTGAGVFAPIVKELTCYRYGASPDAPSTGPGSPPLVTFAITPWLDLSYEIVPVAGTPAEMRDAFANLKDKQSAKRPAGP